MPKSCHHHSFEQFTDNVDTMMHNNIIFDREREAYAMQRKNRMKRMEELSHSLDGLNNLPDDYGSGQRERSQRGGGGGGDRRKNEQQQQQQYNDGDFDDEYPDDDYTDEYYYPNSNAKPSFDGRPRSYNEKYNSSYMYDDYDSNGSFSRNRYSLNEQPINKGNNRYQQSPLQQQKYSSSLRKPQASAVSGNGHHGSTKHILFNDEDDVHYMSDKKKLPNVTKKNQTSSPSTGSSAAAGKKESPSNKRTKQLENEKPSSLQVMKAKLKIHNLSNDDSVLPVRSSSTNSTMNKQSTFHRHHSLEAKLPSHHADRSNMSPTIMEEIEFEMQDVETETEKEQEVDEKDEEKETTTTKDGKKASKEKSKSKDSEKKGNSAPPTPTTKKSLKAHLSNHKKLFKVPEIDLNKFSCFFSSHKNIAALKGKKEDSTSKSAEALNAIDQPSSSKSSPKSSPTTKNPPPSPSTSAVGKTPPSSPKKPIKGNEFSKNEKNVQEERFEKSFSSRTATNRTMGSGSTIQSSSEFPKDEDSISDNEFEVILLRLFPLITDRLSSRAAHFLINP